MSPAAAITEWMTAAEIAAAELPGLPRTKRAVTERAAADGWDVRRAADGCQLARTRVGRGGGTEYHVSLLPSLARDAVAARLPANDAAAAAPGAPWGWFNQQSEKVRAEAARRARVLADVQAAKDAGSGTTAAIGAAAATWGVGVATIKSWRAKVRGVAPDDWPPHLAPDRKGGGVEADIDDGVWQALRSDYLRPERPPFESCYRRALRLAAERKVTLPHARTLRRRLEREVGREADMLLRAGADALRAALPPQKRSVADLHAMQLVNVDGHKWDVFVRFPDGAIRRPLMVAIQDVFSRKVLAWRIGETESAVLTRLAFADLFRDHGIPKGCLLDNGRAFAGKWITGGAKTRFRFKIRPDEPTGLLPAVGINPHWALPYRGSSKPIERAFRDMCGDIAKHPAFAGAYTGNRPDAKPDNYGDAAVPLEAFVATVAAEIAAHNARPGRNTEMGRGVHSFDDVFARSYAVSPIGKATPEALMLALLTADEVRADRRSGEVKLFGNRYWTRELFDLAGEMVTVRFDPDNLTLPAHVYTRDGRFVASAPLIESTGFLDVDAAKRRAKLEREWKAAARRQAEAQELLDDEALARLYATPIEPAPPPEPAVVRPVRHRGQTAAALAPAARPAAASEPDFLEGFLAGVSRLRLVDD